MQRYLPMRVMAVAMILATGMACFGGCATLTPDIVAGWIELATFAFNQYMALRADYEDAETEEERTVIAHSAEYYLDLFLEYRNRINDIKGGPQKALAGDIWQGPVPALIPESGQDD